MNKKSVVPSLFDLRGSNVVTSTINTYETVSIQAEMRKVLRKLKIASLHTELTEDEYFFETVASNRGFLLRVFDSLDHALAWLEGKSGNSETT